MTLDKGGHIPDIMNVPNGCKNEKMIILFIMITILKE